jgi:hypothetical protein
LVKKKRLLPELSFITLSPTLSRRAGEGDLSFIALSTLSRGVGEGDRLA